MLRNAAKNARLSCSLYSRTTGSNLKTRLSRVIRWVLAAAAALLLVLSCVTSSQSVNAAQTASTINEVIQSASIVSSKEVSLHDAQLSGSDVTLQYTFDSGNLVFVLSGNGFLHAYHLDSGTLAWSADVGGDMIVVEVDLPPPRDTVLRDPLALPFFVRGNSLFTRIPFYTYNPGSSSTLDTVELLGNLPESLRPYFFMNISTLLRRQTVFFGGTDIFVTTSVEVADLDSSTGHCVSRLRRGTGGNSNMIGSNSNNKERSVLNRNASSSLLSFPSVHNELLPLLHVVRYNIVVHVVRADEYSWSITLSQLRLSPRTSPAVYRRATESKLRTESKEHNSEANPRFFSLLMRDLLDYDAVHVTKRSGGGSTDHPHRRHARAIDVNSSSTGEKTQLSPEAATLALFETLERRRAEVAEYISRALSMQQFNRSHIRLHNSLEDTTMWTSTLPFSSQNTRDFSCEEKENGGEDVESYGNNDNEVTTPLRSSLASMQAIASYLWVSGAEQIFRIPVQRAADLIVPTEDGPEGDNNIYMESPTDNTADAQRQLRLTATTIADPVVPTQGSLSGLQLVSYPQQGSVSADMRHTIIAMDVESDERESEELDRYYRDPRLWESALLASTPLGSPIAQNVDNPLASFSNAGDMVVRTGLAWRTAGIISFHVLCLAGSIAFLCAGVPPRNQLQRAWAQADRNRDRLSQTSVSRPQSTQLTPQDLLTSGGGSGGSGFGADCAGSLFCPLIDGFSVDSPAQGGVDKVVKTRSPSPVRFDNDEKEDKGVIHRKWEHQRAPNDAASPPHKWDDRTPEEVYTMMREESEERVSVCAKTVSTTASAGDGKGLTPSHITQQSRHSPTEHDAESKTNGAHRLVQQQRSEQDHSFSGSCARDRNGDDGARNCEGDSDSDDDSEEIDMGERWWVRAQHQPRLPSVTTLDETSEKGSSVSLSRGQNNNANTEDSNAAEEEEEEEGKLFQLHFKVLEKIGFGGEGCVFCVEHRVTHARYAIKAILIHEQDEERVVQEAVLHSSFDNANVVRFYFCWIEDIAVSTADRLQLCNVGGDGLDTMSLGLSNRSLPLSSPTDETFTNDDQSDSMVVGDTYHMLFIQMEYFPRGTLADWLRGREGFYRLEVLRYMQNIADGLAYLHNQDVVHRDLKPTNIFVSNANVLKIGDFGLAKRRITTTNSNGDLASNVVGAQQEHSVVGGSPLYCSPEQTRGDPVNKPSDIFSFGIIAVEMLCTFATLHERIRILTDAHQGVLPAEIERDFAEEVHIIRPLLASEPQQRPSLRKVQRQLMRLISTLEDSEQDGEDTPHSPVETAELSRLVGPVGHAHRPKATTAATTQVPASFHQTFGSSSVATVGVFTDNNSPLLRTSASPFSASCKSVAADKVGNTAEPISSSSPLSETPAAPRLLSEDDKEEGKEERTSDAEEQPLPEWQTTDLVTAASSSASTSLADGSPRSAQSHSPKLQAKRHNSGSSSFPKHRNSYHDRRHASWNSTPGAEMTVVTAAAYGRASSPETASQGGASSAEFIVTDPYGPPTTPVTYAGDADLSSILKRDLKDRNISPPD